MSSFDEYIEFLKTQGHDYQDRRVELFIRRSTATPTERSAINKEIMSLDDVINLFRRLIHEELDKQLAISEAALTEVDDE